MMDIYQALRKDHDHLQNLAAGLCHLQEDDDFRYLLINEIGHYFMAHARAEEVIFYNSLRSVEGTEGHMAIETYLLHLKAHLSTAWNKMAVSFYQILHDHFQEEETIIFRKAQSVITSEEAQLMGKAYERIKFKFETNSPLTNGIESTSYIV